jgi:hypothetical protein
MNHPRVLLAVIVAFGAAALSLVYASRSQLPPVPFDKTIWLNGETVEFSSDAPRLRMADGLVDSRILLGKRRSELESLLGPPTKTDKFRNFDLVYWLGADRGFMGIDSEWLVIRLDSNDKTIRASIVSD